MLQDGPSGRVAAPTAGRLAADERQPTSRVESLAARAAGGLSRAGRARRRHDAARASCSGRSTPARSTRSPRGFRTARRVVSATNGKTTTTRDGGGDPPAALRLAWNNSGANLVSGVASTLLARRDAELGLLEVDEGALPEVVRRVRPRAVCSATSSATSSTATASSSTIAERWRAAVGASSRRRDARRQRRRSAGRRARPRAATARSRSASTIPRLARPALQHAADSKYCVRCGTPYEYAAAYVGHLGDYRCPACGHARPPLDVAARAIELRRPRRRRRSTLVTPAGATRVELPLPGPLQRLQRARRRGARARARRLAGRDRAPGWSGSAPRSAASSGSRPATGGS